MKIAALILGILGIVAVGGVGAKWFSDYNKNKDTIALLPDDMPQVKELHHLRTSAELGMAGAVVALGCAFAIRRKPRVTGVAFLIAGVVPGIFAAKMFICGAPLVVAAILALAAKNESQNQATASRPQFRAAA